MRRLLVLAAVMCGLFVPAAANAVTPPANLRVTGTTSSSIALAWDASPDATGYYVWRGDANWNNWTQRAHIPSRTTITWTDTGLPASTTYTYVVRAYDASDNRPSNGVMATTQAPEPPPPGTLFSSTSVWNTPIPASPVLDAKSSTWASYLAQNQHPAVMYEYGTPIYEPPAGTARYTVRALNSPAWGPDPLAGLTVPLLSSYVPSSGSDAGMAVIDWSTNKAFGFWQYAWNGGNPTASWDGVAALDGQGNGDGSTGAGISRVAGVVHAKEIAAGAVNHTLVFGSQNNCRTVYRFPATKTDGWSSDSNCIPEGARVQLDPSVNVDAITGITQGEKIVARALQRYGAILNDNAGARMAFAFETPTDEADPYPAAGLAWDYFNMTHIPWNRLRVLRQADGG